MLVLRIAAANAALVVAWVGVLLALGFRPIPMQLALLAMGLVTSSLLVTRTLIGRGRSRSAAAVSALVDEATQPES